MPDNKNSNESVAHLPRYTSGFTFMGRHLAPVQYQFLAPEPIGIFASYWTNLETSVSRAIDHWHDLTSLEFGQPSVSPAYWNEQVGDRDIPYRPNVSRSELDRLIGQYDRQQYMQRFDPGSPIAEVAAVAGQITGSTLEPASVLTAGFGSRWYTAARLADDLYSTFMYASAGSLYQGSAAAGLTAALRAARGQPVSPARMSINALSSLLLDVPVAGISHGVGRVLDLEGAQAYARSAAANPHEDPYQVVDDMKGAPAPPPERLDADVEQNNLNLKIGRAVNTVDSYFPEYPGGARQWLKELAAGVPAARRKGDALGFDMQSAALRNALSNWGRLSDRSSTPPASYNAQLLQDMRALSPEGRSRLRQNGILTVNDDVREPFEPLFNAATTDPVEQTSQQSAMIRDFVERGAGPIRTIKREAIEEQLKPLRKQIKELRDITRTRKTTKRMQRLRKEADRLKNRILALEIQRDNYTGAGTNRILDDSMPDHAIVGLIDTLAKTRPSQFSDEFPVPEVAPTPTSLPTQPLTGVPDEGRTSAWTGPGSQSSQADDAEQAAAAWFTSQTSDNPDVSKEELDGMIEQLQQSIRQCEATP